MQTKIQFILYVKDQERSKKFYQNVLSKKPVLHVPGMTEFELSQNTKLGLMPESGIIKILEQKTPHPATGNGIPRCELYLKCDDFENYFDRAVKYGAKIISKIKKRDWGDTVGYVADPDGHIIAFTG